MAEAEKDWATAILKHADIMSNHLLEQHRRLQQEIYVRLRSRLSLLNYSIGATGGIATIVAFVLPKHADIAVGPDDVVAFAEASVICFTGAFVYLFFLLNFLSHSGYIYAASRCIRLELPSLLTGIENACLGVSSQASVPPACRIDPVAARIFCWEDFITEARKRVGFTSSRFESWAFYGQSIVSFIMSGIFFAVFVYAVRLDRTDAAFTKAFVSGMAFIGFSVVYLLVFTRCLDLAKRVKEYRDSDLVPLQRDATDRAPLAEPLGVPPRLPRGPAREAVRPRRP